MSAQKLSEHDSQPKFTDEVQSRRESKRDDSKHDSCKVGFRPSKNEQSLVRQNSMVRYQRKTLKT